MTVWYHQPWGSVDCYVPTVNSTCVGYAASVGMTVDFRDRPGTATAWIRSNGLGQSFVVELGATTLSASQALSHATAILAL